MHMPSAPISPSSSISVGTSGPSPSPGGTKSASMLVSTVIDTATPSPTSNSLIAPNHAHGLSGTVRNVVICVATAIPLTILALIVLACRARRRQHALGSFPHHSALPNDTSEYLERLATVSQAESPPYWEPAPSYFSTSHREEPAGAFQQMLRAPEKAAYVPAEGTSGSSSWRGHVTAGDDRGEGERYARSEIAESARPGSSLAAATSPPVYESEAGGTPMHESAVGAAL
ncbi:uncharacterized protein PHACADRAFT_246102 [Phanerochaete carnosa HHB-10118-sp]|uniref:Uncharacterized protein n=1 Tax=Phanerochaete carnosa (strain HHB-10118-sp) TaxID=650164 RepID=K5VBG4_PHACS|nr:uncharacterized protein PHACADRAFT_246102 [Phanerochaete carnosa HHB-10118-sp]EKM60241.1 hypothetical protein PHACADRAFT_246102 [Phanerochaete carnosa HHB-10118-sp]